MTKLHSVVLLLLNFPAALATPNESICTSSKDPSVHEALSKFCDSGNITVSSQYAQNGTYSSDGHAHVWIDADCDPPQYVPPEFWFVRVLLLLPMVAMY